MARLKRLSKVIVKADLRQEGITSINPLFKVTTDLTLVEYVAKITLAKDKQSELNVALGNVDTLANEMDELVIDLREYNTRFLGAVGSLYGKNSSEYEKAGGKRKADYKHRKKATATAPVAQSGTAPA